MNEALLDVVALGDAMVGFAVVTRAEVEELLGSDDREIQR